jgi:hypothetical protein
MTPENSTYLQDSFLEDEKKDKKKAVESPRKKFISVGGKRLAHTMTLTHPGAWIKEESLLFSQTRREMGIKELTGISLHEAAYLWMLMNQHPLSEETDPFNHAQTVATHFLPSLFPSTNKADFARREMILTRYLPEFWPKENQETDLEALNQIFALVHQKTHYPHPTDQPRLEIFDLPLQSNGPFLLSNLVRFAQESLSKKIGEDTHLLCEQTFIHYFRDQLKIKVISRADILIVTQATLMKGVPLFAYDLLDIKSGKRPAPESTEYQQHLYQLWLMKRALMRTSLSQIEIAIKQKKAVIVNNADAPLGNLVINCYLVWPNLRPFNEDLFEMVSFSEKEEKATEDRLYRALNLYRQFHDGKLGKGLSSNRDFLLRKKRR